MDRSKVRAIRADLDKVFISSEILALEKKHGIKLLLEKNASFNSFSFNVKLTAVENQNQDGSSFDPQKVKWDANCSRYGLAEDDFGKKFTVQGVQYKIIGLNTRRPKYPISAVDISTYRSYKFSAGVVLHRLGK